MDGAVVDKMCDAARPPLDSFFSSIARLKHPKGISRPSTEGNPWKGSSVCGRSQEPVIRRCSPVGVVLKATSARAVTGSPPQLENPGL